MIPNSEGLFCQFFQSTECLIPDLHPNLLSVVLKVSSCSGHDLIFVEVNGSCQFPVGRVPSGHKSDHGLRVPFGPVVLRLLIPRSGRDVAYRPLSVLCWTRSQNSIQNSLNHLYSQPLDPGKQSLLLLLPVSRVTLLKSLISYGTIYYFIRGLITHLVIQESSFVKQLKYK